MERIYRRVIPKAIDWSGQPSNPDATLTADLHVAKTYN